MLLIFCLFISLFNQFLNYIVYPIKTLEENNKNFESLLSFNSTYTILEMGTPPKEINFYFNLNHIQVNITDEGCTKNNLYKRENSNSFKQAFELDQSYQDNKTKYLVLDSIYFYNNINLTKKLKIDEYPFFYSSDISKNDTDLCGSIGLAIIQSDYISESGNITIYNEKLKKLGAGKYEDFSFFHYNNQDLLVYSIFLQSEFPDLFKDIEEVIWDFAMMNNNYIFKWEIYMDEVYYNNIHSKNRIKFELNPLFELILGTNEFKINITHDFFESYISKGICILKEYNGLNYFECDSKQFTLNDIKNFPIIYIPNIYAKHIFELKSEELFIQLNNKWYFEIIFPTKDSDYERWILGRIFMRKFPVKFSPSNHLIGFYIKPNEGETEKDKKEKEKEINSINNNSNLYIYIIIIVVALIFTGVGLYIGKKIFNQRKKRANELLDDNYQYESNINKENDKNKQNEIIDNSPIN